LKHPAEVGGAVAFSPDGKTILTGCMDKTTRFWDATTGEPIGTPLTHQAVVAAAVAFSPDGTTFATAAEDGRVQLWDVATSRPLGAPMRHPAAVYGVAFSPDGKTILTGCWDSKARLWDAATGEPLGPPIRHRGTVLYVAFSPDGRTILTGSPDLVRVSPTASLPDDLDRIATWVEALTGLTLDDSGAVRVLGSAEWLQRRQEVIRQGGPPVPDAGR
jgi:WD40 repeat protein